MAAADRAGDPHVGQEVHLQAVRAVSFAGLAAPAGHVETEAAGLVAAGLGLGQLRVEMADVVEELDVGGRVRAGRAADGRLVDGDHLVEMFEPFDAVEDARIADAAVEIAEQGLGQDVVDQRALAGPGNAGHAHQHPQRNLDVDVLEIVVPCAADDELLRADRTARWREPRSFAGRKDRLR